MDPVIPTPPAIPEGCCVFCDSSSQSVERYGKFLHHEESGIYAHYYCMLFACGLSQRGKTHEGIEGFLIKDILAERKRAQKLKCKYCKKKGASVGCSVKACHQIYHYGCGVDEEAIFLFYDSFVSYCVKHRPVQKVLPSDCSPSKGTCPICMEHVETTPSNSVLKTPCCKGTWLHRDCVQMQARSAGYFFRCAICNNENEFQDEMKKFGIYLPEKDADWEFGGEAYQELYERHNRCDVDKCRCPRGRKYCTQSGQWEIVLCDLCGSAGCHVSCGGLVTALEDWACKDCTSTFTRGFLEQNPPTEGRGTVKSTSSPGSQQKRIPGQGGTRVRSAIRSQGKRPRPPPTTPRPLKKTKQSSTPVCPPLSPVSSQQSSLSSSPKSTPCPTMKFPRVSLSPTYEREDSRPGSSRESVAGKYKELLPKLECYVALEPPSRDLYCPNLSMPSLSPAASSVKKRKSSNKLKCKKARKLDLNPCNLPTEIRMAQTSLSKRQGHVLHSSNKNVTTPALISSPSDKGKESTVKLSWGSRLLDSVGAFLWRKSPSEVRTSESSEVSQERKPTGNDSNDIEESMPSQKEHTHVPSLPLSRLESPESLPKSTSPIALSEEVKAQILPVTAESVSKKTKKRLHDLTSWKDDTTWKEAKEDLAQLFQVDGRATRNALKKDGKTPVKTSRQERKVSCINRDDITPKASLQKEQPSSVQSTLSHSYDHVFSHQKSHSPVISEEIKAQINPLNSENVPSKTKNMLNDLTSWKDDSTWKEAKQDLAQLFQVDGRATRSALKKDGKTPVKTLEKERKASCTDSGDIAQKPPVFLKKDGKTPVKTSGQDKTVICVNKDDIPQKPPLQKEQHPEIQGSLSSSSDPHDQSHQASNSPVVLSEKIKAKIIPLTSKGVPSKTKNLLHDLTSWKDDSTWKEAKQDLALLFQVDGRATRSALKKDGKTPVKTLEKERKASCTDSGDIAQKPPVFLKKDGKTPVKTSGQDKTVICVNKDDIPQKPPLQKEQHPEIQGSLSSSSDPYDQSHQASNSPVVLSEKIKAKIIPLTSKGVPSKTKNLLHDLTSWKDDSTWKEAKQDLAQLFQVDGRATRSALKKDGKTPVKTLEKERKSSCSDSGDIAQEPPVSPKRISDVQCSLSTNLDSLDDSPQDSNSPVALSQEVETHIVSLPTESLSRQARNLLNDLTSWKDDTTWKEAKQDLFHLYQVDCRATRYAFKKGGTQLASRTSLCSPAKKKRKLEHNHSPSQSSFSPVCQSGKTLKRIRNPTTGRWVNKKESDNEINLEKVVPHNLPSSNSPFTKESGQINHGKHISEAQGQCLPSGVEKAADMPILPATVTKELASWKDDVTWKEANRDLANLFQVDGRTTRSSLHKDRDSESSSMTKENTTTFEVPDISVLTPLKKSEQVNAKQNFAIEIGCNDFEEVIENEANSSVEAIPQITDSSIAQTDETKSLLESSSTPGKGKKGALDLRMLTDWKNDQTWKEFRGDMAVLLQVDGRTTRNKSQRDGHKGICGTPKLVGKETMPRSIKKVQALSSMPVLKKIVPHEKEICSPNQKLLVEENSSLPSNGTHIQAVMGTGEVCCKDLNVGSNAEKPSSDALLHVLRSSDEIKDSVTYATCSYSTCDPRREPAKEKRKSRKSLSKVFRLNHDAEDNSSKGKSEKYKDDMTPCHDGTLPDETIDNGSMDSSRVTSELDDSLSNQREITSNAEVCENHGTISSEHVSCDGENETPSSMLDSIEIESSVQDARKHVLHDRSSQTTASKEEIKAYVTSMGMHYKPPCYLPPTLMRQDGNFTTRCTQTYSMKYENHNSLCTPSSVPSFANEKNHFSEELTEMPELSDGEITPQKNTCLSKRSEIAKDHMATTKETLGMRCTRSCKKGSRRRGNSCSSPLPHAAMSPKILPVKKPRHASEPPVLTPLESLSVGDDQDDLLPNSKKLNSQDVITDAGNCKQSCVSHSDQFEKVEESGKSSFNEVKAGAIKHPNCHRKRTQLVHQHSFSGNGVCKEASGDLDQRLQTDERYISCQKEQPSALNIADVTLPTRISPKKKCSNSCSHSCSRCVVPSLEDSSKGEIKQQCHFLKRKPNDEGLTDFPTTSQISKMPSGSTNASAQLIKEDVLAGCKSSEAIFEAAKICRSLVDEVLKNAFKQSKCRVKRTEWELLESWTKDGLWKEAKDDVQTLLHAEERITRSRKDHNESKSMHLSEGPSLAKEKTEPFSSTTIVKPSPSLDLRKRKYCCSHMRSPWKASPAKSKSIAHEISTEPKDPQQFSPVFRKLSHHTTDEKFGGGEACASPNHSKRLKISREASGLKSNVNTTPASMKKVWKPRVHPRAETDKQDSRSDSSWSSSKIFGMTGLHTEATRKEEANQEFQECTAKKVGRPRKEVVDIAEMEKSSSPRKQLSDNSEVKKKVGGPRKEVVDIAESENSGSPRKQVVENSEVKKTLGRPRKETVDIAESENSGIPRKQIGDNSEVKKKLGRPRKETVDIDGLEKSSSPRKQLSDNSEVKKKVGRRRKEVVNIDESENSGSPRKQLVDNSEAKKKVGRPRKKVVDIDESEKSCSPRKQQVDNSDVKKRVGKPCKHSVYGQEKSGSPPKKLLHISEDKKRPGNGPVDILEEKLDCGETSKSPENGKFSGVQQSCQGIAANSRNIRKARRRLESSTTELSVAKADDDLAICFVALQEVLQAGKIKTRNSSTQTDATVEEVKAYVASKGKLYVEPCYVMPRPHLDRTEATSDMRTQTYNLELSQCLQNETKRTCPPLVCDKHEAKRSPSSLKKMRSKRRAKRPPTLSKSKAKRPPPTPKKVSSSNISPTIPATLSPIKCSIYYAARTDRSSQTDLQMEEVEAYIQSMGEWYREPSIIVTGSQEGRAEFKNSVRTQTYNMSLPERELPTFKKKFSKRVQNQMKSTQTLVTWEEVKAYIEANKQVYTDPKYFTTQSYFLVGSSLNRHIATQTYSFSQDEVTTEEYLKKEEQTVSKDIKGKGNPKTQQTSVQDAIENAHDSSRELLEPVRRAVMEDVQKNDTQTHRPVESYQSSHKPCAAYSKVRGNGVSKKVKTDSITSGLESKNWFRLKPKK